MKTKEPEMIRIPLALARLLVAKREDMNNPDNYDDVQEIAKASLKLLIEAYK